MDKQEKLNRLAELSRYVDEAQVLFETTDISDGFKGFIYHFLKQEILKIESKKTTMKEVN